jgi:MinD superfamily P-loop ATPase
MSEGSRVVVDERRQLMVAVTGGGRGVGVTSVALHLAASLAKQSSSSVSLVDLDTTWQGAGARLLRAPEDVRTWQDFDGSGSSMRLCALPMPGGFRAFFAPSRNVDPPVVEALLDAAPEHFSVTVLDAPAGERPDLTSRSHAMVMVVSPSLQGVHRARAALPETVGGPAAFVINRLGRGSDITNEELQQALGHRIALELPVTPALRDAEDECRLLNRPWSRWNRRIDALARQLMEL